MKEIPEEVMKYIKSQRVGVLAVEMLDGSPHAATVHYSYTENPLVLFFETERGSRKAEAVLGRKISRASLVIGTDEDNMRTMQIDGTVRLTANLNEEELYERAYLTKFPNRNIKATDPNSLPIVFTPTWWRFTDWLRPEGKTIIYSE